LASADVAVGAHKTRARCFFSSASSPFPNKSDKTTRSTVLIITMEANAKEVRI